MPKVRSCAALSLSMDVIYIIFGFVLAAATLGFLLLCDRLGPRS
jgi:hypothetical protein